MPRTGRFVPELERTVEIPFKPNSQEQSDFIHTSMPQAALVGGVGSGKSVALVLRAWMLSYKYPGNRGVLCMYTYDQIKQALIPKIKEVIPSELMINPDVLDRKDIASEVLMLYSSDPERPSEIWLRNLEDPYKFESTELGWGGISQANDPKITFRTWNYMTERMRYKGTDPNNPIPYHPMFLEANYGGNAAKGGWIWQAFKSDEADQKTHVLFEIDTFKNWENLSEDYKAILASLPQYRRVHSIYGSWDPLVDVKGLVVFPEFKWGVHVPEEAEVGDVRKRATPMRPIIRGIDIPGPCACVWMQMDQDGRLLVLHEVTFDSAIGTGEFADIVQSESATIFPGYKFVDYADPAAQRIEQTSGKSNAQVLRERGIVVRPGIVSVEKRNQVIKDWLNMMVRGGPAVLVDPGCYRIVGGFQGGYHFAMMGSTSGRYAPFPAKNEFSHAMDALAYGVSGVQRLQYTSQVDPGPLPMPQQWLGGLHRNRPIFSRR